MCTKDLPGRGAASRVSLRQNAFQQYNLRSNGNHILEEEIWVDNQFNAIEKEEKAHLRFNDF